MSDGRKCLDCGEDHDSLGALRCEEKLADRCKCGRCRHCLKAAWWRNHPNYPGPSVVMDRPFR